MIYNNVVALMVERKTQDATAYTGLNPKMGCPSSPCLQKRGNPNESKYTLIYKNVVALVIERKTQDARR